MKSDLIRNLIWIQFASSLNATWFFSIHVMGNEVFALSPGLRDSFVHEEEDGFLWRQLDAFPDDPHELGHSDVRRHQVLPLIDVHDLRARNLLHYHLRCTQQQRIWLFKAARSASPKPDCIWTVLNSVAWQNLSVHCWTKLHSVSSLCIGNWSLSCALKLLR